MTILLVWMGALVTGQDDAPWKKSLQAAFDSMEKAVKGKDEAAFKACWRLEGFEKNLVGGSGLAGESVFSQGSRKKWFPEADLTHAQVLGEGSAVLVPCSIRAWEKGNVVDKVDFLLVKDKEAWLVLGAGEKRAQVEALASRWLKKEPLQSPQEKE